MDSLDETVAICKRVVDSYNALAEGQGCWFSVWALVPYGERIDETGVVVRGRAEQGGSTGTFNYTIPVGLVNAEERLARALRYWLRLGDITEDIRRITEKGVNDASRR